MPECIFWDFPQVIVTVERILQFLSNVVFAWLLILSHQRANGDTLGGKVVVWAAVYALANSFLILFGGIIPRICVFPEGTLLGINNLTTLPIVYLITNSVTFIGIVFMWKRALGHGSSKP